VPSHAGCPHANPIIRIKGIRIAGAYQPRIKLGFRRASGFALPKGQKMRVFQMAVQPIVLSAAKSFASRGIKGDSPLL
ncbi:MAG: hypothetical protein IJ131_05445, partial [Eggerthellaceae bacterium]|nr:hypothetical protein [Eggerthellaceae bacterium]